MTTVHESENIRRARLRVQENVLQAERDKTDTAVLKLQRIPGGVRALMNAFDKAHDRAIKLRDLLAEAKKEIAKLQAENAALRARLSRAKQPTTERTPSGVGIF